MAAAEVEGYAHTHTHAERHLAESRRLSYTHAERHMVERTHVLELGMQQPSRAAWAS